MDIDSQVVFVIDLLAIVCCGGAFVLSVFSLHRLWKQAHAIDEQETEETP